MNEKITIIIPSHERHQLLRRAIDYYSKLDLLVLIVDSSQLFLNVQLPENITYLHLPGSLFGDKIYSGLCKASTTYACLCADDDFLSESGLQAGQKFLEENLDYVSVQGHYIQFNPSLPNEQYNPLYLDMIGYLNDSDLIKKRTLGALKAPHIYALHRTASLKKAMHITLNIKNVTVVELSIPIVTMCYGKHAVLPIFWSARDIIRYSKYIDEDGNDLSFYDEGNIETNELNKVVINWKDFLISSDGNKLRNNFIEAVSDVVSDSIDAGDLFDSAFNNYLSRSKRENNIAFKQKLKDIIKFLLPHFIVRKIQVNNCTKLRFAVRTVSGYPWSDDIANKDWNTMIKVILKFKGLI
jgi:glycosyltransferase domain-containing protein